ncbi:ABC-type uncharacterized transport system involved in gliding motility auxiliary subunit [Pseudomonas fluorescens]|uniref:Gldg family protein n=1 Tax=Pseudomonas fluorescens TaxID=294 RepID=UPI0020A13FDF|nr:Gldg family protein [Pseudomonas fluorescens]MCP1488450.1 ABC-type uncharacterized transport system involved in gliding motility auxiliary subunit [Pseudomonas fluorescens]
MTVFAGSPGVGSLLDEPRIDLTEQQLFTLSQGSRQIIEQLAGPTDLYLFFSSKAAKDLPVLRSYAKRVEALLREYERLSHGKLKLHVIDPQAFSTEEDRAREFGLDSIPLGPVEGQVFFGLAAVGPQRQTQRIPLFSLDEQAFLEYEISRLLQALDKPERAPLGLLSFLPVAGGFDEQTRRTLAPWFVFEEIRKAFDIQELTSDIEQIPEGLKVLMLVHPKRVSHTTQLAIDQFVLRGGRLLIFLDPYSEQDRSAQYFGIPSKDKSSDLAPLLRAWGVRQVPGKVLGDGHYGQFVNLKDSADPVWQPTALELPALAMNQQDVVTVGLQSINLTTAGILEPLEGSRGIFSPLLRSSEYSMPFSSARLDQMKDSGELAREMKPSGERFTLAARLQGPAQSAFLPEVQGRPGAVTSTENINVIVVADTDLLSDNLWVEPHGGIGGPMAWADNGVFVLNALDSLSGADALINLRSRGHYSRTFTTVEMIQREAQQRFRGMSDALRSKLDETERQLALLQPKDGEDSGAAINQKKEIDRFMREKAAIGQDMRSVARQLNLQVEKLGTLLKVINIGLVPGVLTFLAVCLWAARRLLRRGR